MTEKEEAKKQVTIKGSVSDIEEVKIDSEQVVATPDENRNDSVGSAIEQTTRKKCPEPFYCPLTNEIFKDPVVAPDGITYERSAIEEKYNKEENTTSKLYPNRALTIILEEYMDTSGDDMRSKLMSVEKSIRQSMSMVMSKSILPSEEYHALNDAYYCAITFSLMKNPMIDPEGNTFDRKAIKHWVSANGNSPITRSTLAISDLYPNTVIRDLLDMEAGKPDQQVHPSVRNWKVEVENVDEEEEEDTSDYPTTPAELQARRAQYRRSQAACNVLGFFALCFLGFMAITYGGYFLLLFMLGCFCWNNRIQEQRAQQQSFEVRTN